LRQLDQRRVEVVALVAQEGQLVLVEALAFQAPAWVSSARLAEQVERQVGQRDVLFEHRAVAAPLGPGAAPGSGRCRPSAAGSALARRESSGSEATIGPHMWFTASGSL
jgi:hypothetical protein